ncbi:MAG: recombinase RecT [Thermomicrobia bacterium]|nr:recombinase RecT [Thermomicrobia bacterium]
MNNALIERAADSEFALKSQIKDLILTKATDAQIDLVVNICNRYGFDPLLKHVVVIANNIYVTRDGLIDNAHRSGQFDGIEVVEATCNEQKEWTATVRVWRKDMQHPFTYTAYQPEHFVAASQAWVKAPRAMTVKCAEVMALKRAFNIALGTAEEMGYDGNTPADAPPRAIGPASTPITVTRAAPLSAPRIKATAVHLDEEEEEDAPEPIQPATQRKLQTIAARNSWTPEDMHELISQKYPHARDPRTGKPSSRMLSDQEAQELIAFIDVPMVAPVEETE